MLEDTIQRIEEKLKQSNLSAEEREKLLELVVELRRELRELPADKREDASSVAAFAEVATSEALREKKNPELLDYASKGLGKTLDGMEQEYPSLTRAVGQLCNFLSSMGI